MAVSGGAGGRERAAKSTDPNVEGFYDPHRRQFSAASRVAQILLNFGEAEGVGSKILL